MAYIASTKGFCSGDDDIYECPDISDHMEVSDSEMESLSLDSLELPCAAAAE